MLNLRFTLLSALLISFLGASIAFASQQPKKRFYYQIRLPESVRSCQEEAVDLAHRFSEVTGLEVTDRTCKAVIELSDGESKYRLYSVVIAYMAKQEVLPYTVFFGEEYWNVPQAANGLYATYLACLSDLQKQTASYEAQAGYRVVASSCQEGASLLKKAYVMRIDGFSPSLKLKEPKKRLYAFTSKFSGLVDESLKARVESLVVKLGGHMVFRSASSLFYYAKNKLPLHHEYLGAFSVTDECVSQLGEAQSLFLNLGSKTVIARCLKDPDPKYPDHATLEVVRDDSGAYQNYSTDTLDYYSFSECIGDRARVKDQAKSQEFTPYGAICRKVWGGKYEMRLYKRERF